MDEEGYAILCSKPTYREGDEYSPEERRTASYAPPSQRFRVQNKRFKTQYSHLYYNRLEMLRGPVQDAAKRKWGKVPFKSVCEDESESVSFQSLASLAVGKESCIVGTLFKRMDLKPSILKAVTQEYSLPMYPPRRKYIATNDNVILEDEKQRITLVGNIPTEALVTGIIAAVKGSQLPDGSFEVADYCFAGVPPLPATPPSCSLEEKYVVFVSGLNVGSAHCNQLALQLMVDYLSGCLGGVEDQAKMRKVVRVIVAGNSITNKPVESSIQVEKKKKKYMSRNYEAHGVEAMKELDTLMAQLASCAHVDIMPGPHDPVNYTLPQQPFHKCTFPKAAQHGTLRGVTNPFLDEVEGRILLGCSGQNVDDIFRYSEETDILHILEQTLHWRHMFPTAPDTVGCYPFTEEDPFIIESAPHVYFTANQPSYQHKRVEAEGGQVLLLAVPNFDVTHSCVLLDLGTLDCSEVHFSTGAFTSLPEEVNGTRSIEEEVTALEMDHSNIVEHISDDEMY